MRLVARLQVGPADTQPRGEFCAVGRTPRHTLLSRPSSLSFRNLPELWRPERLRGVRLLWSGALGGGDGACRVPAGQRGPTRVPEPRGAWVTGRSSLPPIFNFPVGVGGGRTSVWHFAHVRSQAAAGLGWGRLGVRATEERSAEPEGGASASFLPPPEHPF